SSFSSPIQQASLAARIGRRRIRSVPEASFPVSPCTQGEKGRGEGVLRPRVSFASSRGIPTPHLQPLSRGTEARGFRNRVLGRAVPTSLQTSDQSDNAALNHPTTTS